jgi:phosphatidylglycerophosphate synthase
VSYSFTDNSATRPALTRWWFSRLFPLVPRWLAANVLTLLSSGSLLTVLGLSIIPNGLSESAVALVFFIALQIYVAGDHLDGMQAVATKTTSPLGDFIDHYCDLWAGCILVLGFWSLLGSASPALLYAMTSLLTFAFAATYAEREKDQRLHFTRWGALEANVIVAAFFFSWIIPAARAWWRSASPIGMPWYSLVVGTGVAMALGTIVVILRRMKDAPLPLVVAIVSQAALALFLSGAGSVTPIQGWLLLALFGGRYVAAVMHGYLAPGQQSWPDPLACIAAIVLFAGGKLGLLSSESAAVGAGMLAAYCGVTLATTLVRIFGGLRRYWVWVNRPSDGAETASERQSTPLHLSRPTQSSAADPSADPSRIAT